MQNGGANASAIAANDIADIAALRELKSDEMLFQYIQDQTSKIIEENSGVADIPPPGMPMPPPAVVNNSSLPTVLWRSHRGT